MRLSASAAQPVPERRSAGCRTAPCPHAYLLLCVLIEDIMRVRPPSPARAVRVGVWAGAARSFLPSPRWRARHHARVEDLTSPHPTKLALESSCNGRAGSFFL